MSESSDDGNDAVEAAQAPRELTEEDRAKLAELDAARAKFEGQKRWSDVIRTILAKAELVAEPAERVDLLREAGNLYIERSSNQAEAIKCFERLLEAEPQDLEAISRLKEMYEKRRDWEKLIRIMEREASLLDEDDQPLRYLEMAELATARIRKPDVCIGLWRKVLEWDPENPDALSNLATLYERARDWQPLAEVLERITDSSSDAKQLQKLGMIYADKLGDDAGAVRAFRKLLTLDPSDRRAQEQLKRRYIALKAWDELADFYAAQERWDELIRILEREADSQDIAKEERIALLFRVARLWEEQKQKPERAARAYEKILETDSDHLQAAEALSPIYESARDAKKLAAVYEVRLRHIEDPDVRIALLRETGLLYEERLRAPDTAFDKFVEAFSLAPSLDVIREDVERLAERVEGGWDRLLAVYQSAVEAAPSEDDGIELRMSCARVLARVGRVEEAISQYRAVYDARGDHNEAIEALGELYRQTSQYQDLLGIYERRLELEADPELRRKIAYERASLWERELADSQQAVAAYQAILSDYGDEEVDAFRALDRLYEQESKWAELAEILERQIDLGPDGDEELAALKFRLGRVLEAHLAEKARAVDLYREVLTILPEHDGARDALESLLDDESVGHQAAGILSPIYEMQESWEPLIRALRVLHRGSGDRDERLRLLTKIGEVFGSRLGDQGRAFEAFSEGLSEAPESAETLSRLEVLAVEQEKFPQLVELVSRLAAATDNGDLARTLWIRAAEISDLQLNDVDGAVSAYRRVLDLDPSDLGVLNALDELYRRTERWGDLGAVLRRRAEQSTDPTEKEELLAQMAAIHDEFLQQPDHAIGIYKEILELDPTSTRALAALDDLYARQELWSDLADNVDRQLSMSTDPDAQVRLMLRLAELREQRMHAVDAAVEIYREILEQHPDNEIALGALERLIQEPEHQVGVAEILEPIYQSQSEFQKLIGVHEIQARHANAPERRAELLHRMAELYEVALDDPGSAFQCFARALAEDPANEATQEQLERLNRLTGGAQHLAEVYETQVRGVEDPLLAATLHVKAAEIREEQLGDYAGAIEHYQRVLQLDDQHLGAATALERLFQLNERYDELAQIYLTKSRMLQMPDEQKDYLFRAASIYEEILERPQDAIQVFDAVLEIDVEDEHAMDKLIELYLRLEKWEDLLGVYTRKADIVGDPEEKKRLFVEVGAVYERELGNSAKAIDAYQRILEIDPDDLTAIGRLDALYQATSNWEELLSVLEREADLAVDPGEVISYRYRIADLWHHKLGDALRAVDIYREILDVVSDHEPTLQALESMVSEGMEPVAAAGVLEPVYRQIGEWAKLIDVHEVQIRHEQDPLRAVELLHQVAELREFQVDQPSQAFEAYARALPLDSRNEHTLSSLERLAEQINGWGEVTRLYDLEISSLREGAPEDVVDMALRTAQIYEVQVGDVDAAVDRYRLVIDGDPGHLQAIEALDRLYESAGRWADLADILDKEISVASTPDDILGLQFRLGQVYENHLGDVDKAIERYQEILAAAPEHTAAMHSLERLFEQGVRPVAIGEVLEPLYRMQGAWDQLVTVHEVQLTHHEDVGERVAMMHRIAEIAEDRAGDHQRAFVWMQRALLEDPSHDHSIAEVERLGSILDGWHQLASTYVDTLESSANQEQQVLLGKRLARVYEEEVGDVSRAEETYRYVLKVQPDDEDTLVALDRIYVEHGAHVALADVLRKRIASSDRGLEQVELHYRLGQLLENDLGQTDEAIQTYQHILQELEPEHAESIRALEDIYTRLQDWQNLFNTFEKELDVVVGDTARADILARMARLGFDQLTEPDKSIDLWRQVLDLRGEDPESLNALGNIYATQSNWADLVDVLEREVSVAESDELRMAIYADLARIWYEKLEREGNALQNWERVLDIDPANLDALFQIAEIYRASSQWHELADTLQHRIIEVGAATLDDSTLESVYMQLGRLYSSELQQPMDAVEAYNHVFDLNAHNFEAMDELERIHRDEGMSEDAIRVMERRAQVLEPAERKIEQLIEIANMWAESVGDPDRGTSAYQRILETEPMHELAFERLEQLHKEAGRWEDLIEMYLGRADATEDGDEQVGLLRNVAEVYEEQLDDKEQAFEALQLAWSINFSDNVTSAELERVTGATNRWNELLNSANEALRQVEDPPTKIAICLHCARWYGQHLGHPEYAIPYYQQILALDPGNVPAMRQMAELYRTTQQWETLAQVLGRLVEMTDDNVVRAETFVQMGELAQENLGLPEQAEGYFQRALSEEAQNVPALEALERIYREKGRWNELLDVLKRKADALEEPDAVLEAKLNIAEAYETRIGDVQAAIEIYRDVLSADDRNLSALRGLERLYTHTEQWPSLLEVLQSQYEVVTTEKERVSILTRLAAMEESEFLRPDHAAERLELVLDIDPTHDEALNGLARLYHGMQRWDDLIGTYERHVSATPDRAEKIRIFKAVGEVYANELSDDDRAIDSYLNVLNMNADDAEALDALTRLYDKRGEHSSALEMMEQLARLLSEPTQQVDLKYRMGRILDDELGDRVSALEHYQTAVDLEPGHLPSLEAMRKIHCDSGDWIAAARVLEQEAAHTENPRVVSKLLVELGRIYDEQLDEHDHGIEMFESAYERDSDNEDAALPLVEEYVSHGKPDAAFPLLQMLVKRSSKREPEEQHRLAFMLGETASELGQDEEAIKALTRAYQLNSTHLPSLIGLAAAHYRAQQWDKAFKYYQMLLVHHRDSLGREEITGIFHCLGVIKREQGERRKALNMFDKALEEDSHHRPTLEAMVDLYSSQNEWEQVIHFKKTILEVATDEDECFSLYDEIGDLWSERLANMQRAIQNYADAADLKPKNHVVLHKLLGAYQTTKQWENAVSVIDRIADLDERPAAKAKYAYTVGVILRDELKDHDAAVAKFNSALDMDADQLKPFEAINKIFTAKKDWKGLERAYRKMLHRVIGQGKTDLEFNLWHTLGIVYRDRQKNFDAAAEAFQMSSQLKPEVAQQHQILAEIYTMMPERVGEAINEHQWLLRQDPYRVESYRALYKLYFDARAYDKAWCLSATLSFLKKADAEQQQFYAQYRSQGMIRPQSRVDRNAWFNDLFHPDEDRYVSKIMELLAPAVHAVKSTTDKSLGLARKKPVDIASSTVTFVRTFGFVLQVLDIPIAPRLFLEQQSQGGLAHMPGSNPPTVVAGATLLSGYSPQDLAFVLGRFLNYYKHEHFVRTLLTSHTELRMVLLAGMRMAGVSPADPQVEAWVQQLAPHVQPAQLDGLRQVCRKLMESGGQADIKRWMQVVEVTGIRAGFLVCNDLDTATRMIQALPPEGSTDLTPKEKVKELVLFSVSENYFRLREKLGIQIQV